MPEPDLTRERLLTAAGQVFAQEGYQGATIRKIKDRAGANIAAVNYYFGDKERLYIEAVKYAHGDFMKGMEFPDWPVGTAPKEKLAAFIRTFVNRLMDPDRPQWHAQLIMKELASPSTACFEIVRDNIRPVEKMLNGILAEILPPETPTWKRFMTGFSIIGQCLYYCQNKPIAALLVGEEEYQRDFNSTTVTEHITQFTFAALGIGESRHHSGALSWAGSL
jgi:AcrR family transcriptional regulator